MSHRSLPPTLLLSLSLSLALSLVPASAMGQSLDMLVAPAPVQSRAAVAPARLAERSALAADSSLTSAEVGAIDELVTMRRWNDEGRLPRRNGFLRPLASPRSVDFGRVERSRSDAVPFEGGVVVSEAGSIRWSARVAVENGWRLRLVLREVFLPEGVRMWVYSDSGETVGPFGLELRGPDATLYTPSVAGPRLTLEIELPRGVDPASASFELRDLVQLFSPQDTVSLVAGLLPKGSECLKDANCVTTSQWEWIDLVQQSVGHIQFGAGFVCSGNLLNNTNEDLTPYFLTANHCFSNQADASSLEVFWDYETPSCDSSNWPDIDSLPRSNGSVLLASGASSDYTLVRLNGLSGNRTLLGWNANGVVNNQMVHRVSHPWPDDSQLPYPHVFTRYRVDTSVPICDGSPRSHFIHTKNVESATFGGSSGAALLNVDKAQVVGQLTGACGPDPNDGCNFGNTEVDGDFKATFPNVQEWLAPGGGGIDYPPCEPDATTLCIDDSSGDGRFQITMTYDSVLGGGFSGTSQAIALNDVGITRGGVMAFTNPANPEVLIKVLDACGAPPVGNEHFWVFYAATTTVGFTIQVIDTQADVVKTYSNPDLNAASPVTDTAAFPTCDV